MKKDVVRTGVAFLAMAYRGGKPFTGACCWQTMSTSKPQLWNCGAVRGDIRSPLCFTWVCSSVQTFVKKSVKGQSNQTLQYFFKSPATKWEGMTEQPFSSPFFYMYLHFSKGFPMFYLKQTWNMKTAHRKAWAHSSTCLADQGNKTNKSNFFAEVECVLLIYRGCATLENKMLWPSLRSGDLSNRNVNSIEYKTQQPVHIRHPY